jgi:phenylacetate-coenzyme A ligase PaaK-like adenylate-forming protein
MNRNRTTPWLSPHEDDMSRRQAAQLRRFLRDVVLPFSPYYARLFREHGLRADDIRSLDDLRRIPFTTKRDLLNTPEHPERAKEFIITPDPRALARRPSTLLRALVRGRSRVQRELESEFRPTFLTLTTGRSADPVPFLFTRHDLDQLADAGRRLFSVCGAARDMRLLNMFPFAPHLAFWLAHFGAQEFGVFTASTGGGKVAGTEGQLRFMRRLKPDVLIGMPTFVYHVLQQAVEESLRCENLRRIVLGGEKVPAGLRRKLVELAAGLGADIDVVATYGFTEARTAWAECPHPNDEPATGYHLYPDLGIFEVIDPDTGEPLPPGTPGELVFTPLDGRGTVVLRYRTGDVIDGGLSHQRCPRCGRTVPRLVGQISRRTEVREMRLDKIKGTLVDFNELEHLLDDDPRVGAWQIELRKRHDDPLDVDELILHVNQRDGGNAQTLARELGNRVLDRTEIHPNQVLFHDAAEMRALQGVGSVLKEARLVDHRPAANGEAFPPATVAGGPGVPPARGASGAGVPPVKGLPPIILPNPAPEEIAA